MFYVYLVLLFVVVTMASSSRRGLLRACLLEGSESSDLETFAGECLVGRLATVALAMTVSTSSNNTPEVRQRAPTLTHQLKLLVLPENANPCGCRKWQK